MEFLLYTFPGDFTFLFSMISLSSGLNFIKTFETDEESEKQNSKENGGKKPLDQKMKSVMTVTVKGFEIK